MVQRSDSASFALEPLLQVMVSRKGFGEDLERHLAVQLGVGGLPDFAQAAFADEGGHVVVAEAGADC